MRNQLVASTESVEPWPYRVCDKCSSPHLHPVDLFYLSRSSVQQVLRRRGSPCCVYLRHNGRDLPLVKLSLLFFFNVDIFVEINEKEKKWLRWVKELSVGWRDRWRSARPVLGYESGTGLRFWYRATSPSLDYESCGDLRSRRFTLRPSGPVAAAVALVNEDCG